jgi:tetraacyldisaccharide 4'-kinase
MGPSLLRVILRVCELPYTLAVRIRNRRFDRGRTEIHRVDVPVVSVGNITTGGTGKTPMVEWLARWYRERDVRVALISRGYGAQRGAVNDEALELEEKLPDVPHLQDPDRVKVARIAVDELDSQLLVLDDGFQHRRIHRDLEIVLIDALDPFGAGHLLPRGLLREPLSSLKRADIVALTRANQVDDTVREEVQAKVTLFAPEATWIEVAQEPKSLLSAGGKSESLDAFAGKKVLGFCGIGNPTGFRKTLGECGFEVVELKEFPDHHRYSREDIQSLATWAESFSEVEAILCTHKDLVKIEAAKLGVLPLWAVRIGVEIRVGQEHLERMLAELLPSETDESASC